MVAPTIGLRGEGGCCDVNATGGETPPLRWVRGLSGNWRRYCQILLFGFAYVLNDDKEELENKEILRLRSE